MKEKRDLFIELSLQRCKKDDYADSKKVKMHNKAVEKLSKLKDEITVIESEEILNYFYITIQE